MARAAKKGAPAPVPQPEPEASVASAEAAPAAPVETPVADAAASPPEEVVMDVVSGDGSRIEAGALLIGAIEVTALQPSRWRAGRKFTAQPTVIPLGDLTHTEVEAINADPLLSVKTIAVPA